MRATFEGKIYKILESVSGISKSGKSWEKSSFLLKDNKGDLLQIDVWGRMIHVVSNELMLNEGDMVRVEVNVKSREYKGKYYTGCTLSDISLSEKEGIGDSGGDDMPVLGMGDSEGNDFPF